MLIALSVTSHLFRYNFTTVEKKSNQLTENDALSVSSFITPVQAVIIARLMILTFETRL